MLNIKFVWVHCLKLSKHFGPKLNGEEKTVSMARRCYCTYIYQFHMYQERMLFSTSSFWVWALFLLYRLYSSSSISLLYESKNALK